MPLMDKKPENETESRIIETLEKIRPFLQRDGGDIAFDRYDAETGTVYVKVIGACMGCLFIGPEITEGVTTILQDEIPEVNIVQIVDPTEEEMQDYGLSAYPPDPFGEYPGAGITGPALTGLDFSEGKGGPDKKDP